MPKRKPSNLEEPNKTVKKQKSSSKTDLTSNSTRALIKENLPWPEGDVEKLVAKIEGLIPKDDILSYGSRLEKISWPEVAFKFYTADQCKEMWGLLSKPVRKFRRLGEIVTDVKVHLGRGPPQSLHPEKPKQPLNSYMFFVHDKRLEVSGENPDLSPCHLSKKLGEMFQNLSPNEKKKYEDRAKAAREEYDLKLQEFYEENPDLIPRKASNGNFKKKKPEQFKDEPIKPKKPFDLFAQQMEKDGEMGRLELHEKWDALNDEEKYFWIKWAEETHIKYIEDAKEFLKTHPDYNPKPIKNFLTKREQKIKDKCTGKPEKPPHAAYHLFTKMIMDDEKVRSMDNKQLMTYISERWNSCSDDEKNEYKIRVNQMWQEFDLKLEEYVQTLPPEDRDRVREEEGRKTMKKEKPVEKKRRDVKVKLKKPPTPPLTEFDYFAQSQKIKIEDIERVWAEMSENEKSKWKSKLDKQKHVYILEYEKYLKSLSQEELQQLGAKISQEESSSEEDE